MTARKNKFKVGDVVSLARYLGTRGEGLLWRVYESRDNAFDAEVIFCVTGDSKMNHDGLFSTYAHECADEVDVLQLCAQYAKLGNIINDIAADKSKQGVEESVTKPNDEA